VEGDSWQGIVEIDGGFEGGLARTLL
jgi:hypothetical protein